MQISHFGTLYTIFILYIWMFGESLIGNKLCQVSKWNVLSNLGQQLNFHTDKKRSTVHSYWDMTLVEWKMQKGERERERERERVTFIQLINMDIKGRNSTINFYLVSLLVTYEFCFVSQLCLSWVYCPSAISDVSPLRCSRSVTSWPRRSWTSSRRSSGPTRPALGRPPSTRRTSTRPWRCWASTPWNRR